MIPGEYFVGTKDIECNPGRDTVSISVANRGDRPVQIGSHFHFFEVNRQMEFDREKAFGMRLNIAAGTAVRFEPGEEKEVELVAIGGNKKIFSINNLVNGSVTDKAVKDEALKKLLSLNFKNK